MCVCVTRPRKDVQCGRCCTAPPADEIILLLRSKVRKINKGFTYLYITYRIRRNACKGIKLVIAHQNDKWKHTCELNTELSEGFLHMRREWMRSVSAKSKFGTVLFWREYFKRSSILLNRFFNFFSFSIFSMKERQEQLFFSNSIQNNIIFIFIYYRRVEPMRRENCALDKVSIWHPFHLLLLFVTGVTKFIKWWNRNKF